MPVSQQAFFADRLQNGTGDLYAAYLALPEDKRNWKPAETARTAVDMIAECALNHNYVADVIETMTWTVPDYPEFAHLKEELVTGDADAMKQKLDESTHRLVSVVQNIPDEELSLTVETPYGTMTKSDIATYVYWNLSYHEGQINYIASILGV